MLNPLVTNRRNYQIRVKEPDCAVYVSKVFAAAAAGPVFRGSCFGAGCLLRRMMHTVMSERCRDQVFCGEFGFAVFIFCQLAADFAFPVFDIAGFGTARGFRLVMMEHTGFRRIGKGCRSDVTAFAGIVIDAAVLTGTGFQIDRIGIFLRIAVQRDNAHIVLSVFFIRGLVICLDDARNVSFSDLLILLVERGNTDGHCMHRARAIEHIFSGNQIAELIISDIFAVFDDRLEIDRSVLVIQHALVGINAGADSVKGQRAGAAENDVARLAVKTVCIMIAC